MRSDRVNAEDVPVNPRVTPLAMLHNFPSGVHLQASRHAISVVSQAQWFRSKKAANSGFAPDAANVFNGTSIKANSAFMLAPLIPQTPFNKGDLTRASNIMEGNYAQPS